jgi:carboxyl-terminal processing protease
VKENYYDAIQTEYEALKSKILHDKSADLITYKDEIKLLLKDEIVARYYYQRGRIVASLNDDPEIAKAIEVLQGTETYLAILDGSKKLSK